MTWLDEIDPIARKKFMEKYELSYPKFVGKFPKFHSTFWLDIDSIRYYNELLKELNIENRRWITYPNILEKTLLVLILIAMLYNSGPQPNVNAYVFLSVFLFYFIFYFVCCEALQMIKGNRLPCEFKRFYKELNSFSSMVPSNNDQKLEYQKLKLRILSSLDTWQCVIILIILILEMILNCVMIAASLFVLGVRANNGYRDCCVDALCLIISCSMSISITLLYSMFSFQNLQWLRKFKLELLMKEF